MSVAPPKHVRERRGKRFVALQALGFDSYADYLRSGHWQDVKRRYRASDLPQACICEEVEVHLHHMTYERIGAEQLADLTPLCGRCHALVHVLEYRGEIALDLEGLCDENRGLEARALLAQLAKDRLQEREQRLADQRAELRTLPIASRLMRAYDHSKYRRHVDIGKELRFFRHLVQREAPEYKLLRRIVKIEAMAYGWDDWNG